MLCSQYSDCVCVCSSERGHMGRQRRPMSSASLVLFGEGVDADAVLPFQWSLTAPFPTLLSNLRLRTHRHPLPLAATTSSRFIRPALGPSWRGQRETVSSSPRHTSVDTRCLLGRDRRRASSGARRCHRWSPPTLPLAATTLPAALWSGSVVAWAETACDRQRVGRRDRPRL